MPEMGRWWCPELGEKYHDRAPDKAGCPRCIWIPEHRWPRSYVDPSKPILVMVERSDNYNGDADA